MKGSTLRSSRLKLGLTQTELGARMGVRKQSISQFEQEGRLNLPETTAQYVAALFPASGVEVIETIKVDGIEWTTETLAVVKAAWIEPDAGGSKIRKIK